MTKIFTIGNQLATMGNNSYILTTDRPFIPSDLSGLYLWFRSDVGVTKDESNYVSNLVDQSGGGNDVTQGTLANQPLYVPNILNGNPVIRFDGINDYLMTSNNITKHSSFSCIVVVSPNTFDSTDGGRVICGVGANTGGSNTRCYDYDIRPTGKDFWRFSNLPKEQQGRTTEVTNTLNVFTIKSQIYKGGNNYLDFYISKTKKNCDILDAGDSNGGTAYPFSIGNSGLYRASQSYFSGDFAEFILYNKNLNETELFLIVDYLRSKYNL